jgi:multiple sugar transport system substrate-binding protein
MGGNKIMLNSKKTFAIVLALIMVLGILGGCGTAKDSGTGASAAENNVPAASESSTAQSAPAETAPAEKVELSMLYWADGVQKQLISDACAAYEAKTGVKINAEALPADETFEAYIQTRKEANTLPDVSYIGETDIMKYNAMGILADLSDLFDSGKINKKLDAVTIKSSEGKTLGVGLSNQLVLLYYNKDMFDKAGLPVPPSKVENAWSWDQFVEIAKKLTVDTKGRNATEKGFDPKKIKTYGIGFNCLREFHQFWAMYANGGGIVSPDGKQFLWDTAQSADGLQKLVDLVHKDHVASQALYTWQSSIGSVADALGGGGYAMYTNGSWDLANLPNIQGVNVGVGVLPKMEKASTMNCGGPMVVYNTSKHIEQAKDFYAYMVDPEKNLDIIKTGAWLPNEAAWYTDQALISKWTANLPATAVETILSYSNTDGSIAQWPAYYVPAYKKMSAEYEKYIDKALSGEKSVKDVFSECMPTIKQLYESGTVE